MKLRFIIDPPDRRVEKGFSELLTKAVKIVGQMQNTPDSAITALLERLEPNQENDEVREGLKREISVALIRNGIPLERTNEVTTIIVDMLMAGIKLEYAKHGDSIVLCLRCLSLESLLRLREMMLSGRLLRILSDAIKRFSQCETRVQLIVRAEDFNKCASYFYGAAGKPEFFRLTLKLPY